MENGELLHTEEFQGFEINLYALPEYDQPDWDFPSEEEKQELLRKIDNGVYMWFTAKVTASKLGIELGSDYLGACCYESTKQFIEGGYYESMRDEAVNQAKTAITALSRKQKRCKHEQH
jgi:hypothetical protein